MRLGFRSGWTRCLASCSKAASSRALIGDYAVTGATSNPTIFAKAITTSDLYDDQLRRLVSAGQRDLQELFFSLALDDVREAARLLRPEYDRTGGADGFISFECTPDLADDTEATIAQARDLWQRLDQPNVMIKVPGTTAGVPAIEELTRQGVNINVTLLFSIERYEQVIDAYLRGLMARAESGAPLDSVGSVASFFLSRIDVKVDERLPEGSPLRGRAALASRARCLSAVPGEVRRCGVGAARGSGSQAPARRCGRAPQRRTPITPTCFTSRS